MVSVCVCVCACVRACVRACACVNVFTSDDSECQRICTQSKVKNKQACPFSLIC